MAVTSCGTVEIKNQEWCGDFGPQGAYCFNTLTTDERSIGKEQWDQDRRAMVCTVVQNFSDTKAVIEKLCHSLKKCSYQEEKQMADFFNRMARIERAQRKRLQ